MKNFQQLIQNIHSFIPPAEFYRAELHTMSFERGDGWCDGGLCPFHDDQHPGSFKVNLDIGAFKCFSCCFKGGDIIAFIQLRDSLSFLEAIHKLTDEWGL